MSEVWAVLVTPSFWVTALVSAVVGAAVSWVVGTRRTAPVLMIDTDTRPLDDPGLPDIQVMYKDELLFKPAVVRWTIQNRGRRDLTSASFDQGRPITLPVRAGADYVAVMTVTPDDLPVQLGSEVLVGPAILRAGSDWRIDLLVSGLEPTADQPPAGLEHLVGVRQLTPASLLLRRRRAAFASLAVGTITLAVSLWSLGASVGTFFVLMPLGSVFIGMFIGLYSLGSERRREVPSDLAGEPRSVGRVAK